MTNQEKSAKAIKTAKRILNRVHKVPINKNYKLEKYAELVYQYRNNDIKKFGKEEARDYLCGLHCPKKKNNNKEEGIVYIIGNKEQNVCKIGYTSDSVEKRLKSIQTSCPYKLEILKTWKGLTKKDEKIFHKEYQNYNLNGEWFKIKGKLNHLLKS